jgi:hypothetical protein
MICFTDALACAPAIQLSCGHVFHEHCSKSALSKRWAGPRITFSFAHCPICKVRRNLFKKIFKIDRIDLELYQTNVIKTYDLF